MSLSQRLKILCDYAGSQKNFADITGIQRQTINRIIKEGTGVRSETIESIVTAYPNLNLKWLIIGEGEMWEGDPPTHGQYPQNHEVHAFNEPVNEEGLTKKEEELALKLVESLEKRIKMMEAEIARTNPDLARRMGIEVDEKE